MILSMFENINKIDGHWTLVINHLSGNSLIDGAMATVSSSWPWITFGLCAVLFFIYKRNTAALSVVIIGLLTLAISDYTSFEYVKHLVKRERPCWELPGTIWVLKSCGGSYGFTSNHAANAAAFVTTLYLYRETFSRTLIAWAIFLAFLVGFSRIYLGVHYVGDVLGGFVFGALVAFIVKNTPLKRWTDRVSGNLIKQKSPEN